MLRFGDFKTLRSQFAATPIANGRLLSTKQRRQNPLQNQNGSCELNSRDPNQTFIDTGIALSLYLEAHFLGVGSQDFSILSMAWAFAALIGQTRRYLCKRPPRQQHVASPNRADIKTRYIPPAKEGGRGACDTPCSAIPPEPLKRCATPSLAEPLKCDRAAFGGVGCGGTAAIVCDRLLAGPLRKFP